MTYKRTDANQTEIMDELRKQGFSVWSTSDKGKGGVDLIAGKDGVNYLIEVKDGSKPMSKQKLTPDEIKFHSNWKGIIHIIRNKDEIKNL